MKVLGKEYRENYDVIIVGAGIGGLFCANLLAAEGLKVLVVEQHYVLGGYCSTFRKKGFVFDSATHFYPLLGNPETLTGRLLEKLDIPTRWIKMDPVDKFHFPNGDTFVVPADYQTYIERLKNAFPHQAKAIDAFFSEVREAYLHGLLFYFRDAETAKAQKYRAFTLEDKLLEHIEDPKLRANLTADHSHWGSLPEKTSFLFDSMLRLAYFLGNYYPKGSSQAFADDLGRAFQRRGGDILLYSRVNKILVENGRVCGIEARTRRKRDPQQLRFRAPVVVSNADILQTYRELVGADLIGPKVLEDLQRMRPSRACFMLHAGLQGMDRRRLEEIEGYYWNSWDVRDLTTSFFKIFFTTLLDPEIAPPGRDILIVQKWSNARYGEIEDWQTVKRETEDYVLDQLRRLIPDLDDRMVIKLSATALTSYRFTLNHQGAMLGWEMSPDQLGAGRPSNITPIEGLYLVGHWTQPGGGITPVIVSAQKVARLILSGRRGSRESWMFDEKWKVQREGRSR